MCQTNKPPEEFIWAGDGTHVYVNQVDGIKEQLQRSVIEDSVPLVILNKEVKSIFDFTRDDIEIVNYQMGSRAMGMTYDDDLERFRKERTSRVRPDGGERQCCKACGEPHKFDFQVKDVYWIAIVPEHLQEHVVCLECFDHYAYQKDIDYSEGITGLYFAGDGGTVVFERGELALWLRKAVRTLKQLLETLRIWQPSSKS